MFFCFETKNQSQEAYFPFSTHRYSKYTVTILTYFVCYNYHKLIFIYA